MQEDFNFYYKNLNKSKKITFCINQSTALLQAKYNPKNIKLFDLGGTQAIVLLAFNDLTGDQKSLSYEELLEVTGLSDSELKKAIITLSISQMQILKIVDDETPIQVIEKQNSQTNPDGKSQPLMMSKTKSIKKTISKQDRFEVNLKFRSNKKRIQVNTTLVKKENR